MAYSIPMLVYAGTKLAQGYQQSRQLKYSASLDEANARVALQQGASEEEAIRRRNAMAQGEARANAVQSGFDANTGSLADLQTMNAGELELDALTTRYRAGLEALGRNTDAQVKRANARNAFTSGALDAFATLYAGDRVKSYADQATKITTRR